MTAILVLEDGTTFEGESFGAQGECTGEVVFNTSMTGYQEVLTDPSYNGQIVTMTYPLIGNTGVNPDDMESRKPQIHGFVVREYCSFPSNWRSTQPLGEYLKEQGIPAIEDVDTRMLTRHIRAKGAMKGILSTVDFDIDSLMKKLEAYPGLVGQDLVHEVSVGESYGWENGGLFNLETGRATPVAPDKVKYRVAAYDFGMKENILRHLVERGCEVTVFPADASAEQVLETNPDGVFLSNGPGDPDPLSYAIDNVKKLIQERPTFGICLGHELVGLALGGEIFKLKFGHRGANQPVKELATGKVEITSQNHGFALKEGSMNPDEVEVTHVNLNDGTVEGLRHKTLPVFSVQYHPEASAGPHDAEYLFDRFVEMMEKRKGA